MVEICIVRTNAGTKNHTMQTVKSLLSSISYLVLVGSVVLYKVSLWLSLWFEKNRWPWRRRCSAVSGGDWSVHDCVSLSLPLRLSGLWLALGDAASFSFPVAELMRLSSSLFGEMCCLASISWSEHGIKGLMGSSAGWRFFQITFKLWKMRDFLLFFYCQVSNTHWTFYTKLIPLLPLASDVLFHTWRSCCRFVRCSFMMQIFIPAHPKAALLDWDLVTEEVIWV